MIKLHAPSLEFAPDLFEAVTESLTELKPWMPWATSSYTLKDAEFWLSEMAPQSHEFLIFDLENRYLGNVGVNTIRTDNQFANIGYWIRTSAHGQGYATEAVKELVRWTRENTDINRLEIVAGVDNHASKKVAEKSGAEFEGIAKSRLLLHGKFHNAAIYSFTK